MNNLFKYIRALNYIRKRGVIQVHEDGKLYSWAMGSLARDVSYGGSFLYGHIKGLHERLGTDPEARSDITRYYEDLMDAAKHLRRWGESYWGQV